MKLIAEQIAEHLVVEAGGVRVRQLDLATSDQGVNRRPCCVHAGRYQPVGARVRGSASSMSATTSAICSGVSEREQGRLSRLS